MNKLEDQKRHSSGSDVSPFSDLWTDGLICVFEFVRGDKKVLAAHSVVKDAANKQVLSPERTESHHSRKNVKRSSKRGSGIGQNRKEEDLNYKQNSHSGHFRGREGVPKSCWVPIGWDRISDRTSPDS